MTHAEAGRLGGLTHKGKGRGGKSKAGAKGRIKAQSKIVANMGEPKAYKPIKMSIKQS